MANGESLNPLTEADRPRFNRIRELLSEAIPFIERLEKCGMPCADNRATCEEIDRFCGVVEAEFLPPVPSE